MRISLRFLCLALGAALPLRTWAQCSTVTQVIHSNPDLSTLSAAIDALQLDDDLNDQSLKATIFAPNNAAFGALLDMLGISPARLLANTSLLSSVVEYHVVPGIAAYSADLGFRQVANTMLQGQTLEIRKASPVVRVIPSGGPTANVIKADIPACQAVVHIIDTVLLPAATPTPQVTGMAGPAAGPVASGPVVAGPVTAPAPTPGVPEIPKPFPKLTAFLSSKPIFSHLNAFATALSAWQQSRGTPVLDKFNEVKANLEAYKETYLAAVDDIFPDANPIVPLYCLRPETASIDCLTYGYPPGVNVAALFPWLFPPKFIA